MAKYAHSVEVASHTKNIRGKMEKVIGLTDFPYRKNTVLNYINILKQ